MYVRRLEIRHLRAFREADIELLYPGREREGGLDGIVRWPIRLPNVNVFLGMNGSGKSTVLYAIALALLSPIISSSGYRPFSLIRRSNSGVVKQASVAANVVLHPQDGPSDGKLSDRFMTHIYRRGDFELLVPTAGQSMSEAFFDEDGGAYFMLGYGATRRTEAVSAADLAQRRRARSVRYDRVATLFEEHLALVPLSTWLPAWRAKNPDRYKQVESLLNKLMPEAVKFTGEFEGGDFLFRHRTLKVPYTALSDGYRTYIGWIGDLLYHLSMGAPSGAKLVDSRGVVMVDEIDLHIHPAWQRTIIPTLARTLKNIQFVFTTHSPLVVGTVERANVFNVESGRAGTPVITRPDEETFGLSADQILRSEVFGLDSTRDPEFRKELDKLSQAAQRGEEGAALKFMRNASIGAGQVPDSGEPPEWLQKLSTQS
jgi:AAA domain, putative AbiEii toxin, Type IV TA system/AAA domain